MIESLILQGSIFSETQSVLKYLLGKFKGIANGTRPNEIIDETSESEDLSEYVRNRNIIVEFVNNPPYNPFSILACF